MKKPKKKITLLYLHGLGCRKEDFEGARHHLNRQEVEITTFDFPGCGEALYPQGRKLGVDEWVEITHQFVMQSNLQETLIVGHSMGGLVGLLYAQKYPEKIAGFINIEGNLASEDCIFSREGAGQNFITFKEKTLPRFIQTLSQSKHTGSKRYAESLKKADPKAILDASPSLVRYSDSERLIEQYVALRIPTLFIYGDESPLLSYLPELKQRGCEVVAISESGHFPQHDNPKDFYTAVSYFLNQFKS